MTDSTETVSTPAASVNAPAPARTVVVHRSPLAALAFLLAFISLLGIAALFYRDNTQRELTDFRLQSLIQDQSTALSQARQQIADQRADIRSTREQSTAQFNQLRAQMETQQQRLVALATTDRSDWQLAEAEYLLQLANQRLLLSGDPKIALEQLVAADDIIHKFDDSGLLPARAALAKDIAALKTVEVVDTEGIYLAIEAVAEQVQQLELIEPVTMKNEVIEPVAANASLGDKLHSGLRAALKKLDQLIQIRRRDQPYQPVLAPQYEEAMQQNLKLAFEQAQVALLMNNQKLYEHSLGKAQTLLTTYYTVDEHATQIVNQAIDELKKKHVAVTLPDISQSRRELKAYLNMRRAQQGAGVAGAAQ
jgi:uroporphyrin-3 C-methyltransferase